MVEGLLIDRAGAMTSLCVLSTFQELGKFEAWLVEGLRLISKATAGSDLSRSRLIAIASAPTAERASSGDRSTHCGLEVVAHYLKCLLGSDGESNGLERQEAYQAMRQQCKMGDIRNRGLFVTTTSGMLGLGPSAMQEGDVVAILRGSSCPCLLRPLGREDYRFVGVVYVYGIMEGEAVLDAKDRGKEEVVFSLR